MGGCEILPDPKKLSIKFVRQLFFRQMAIIIFSNEELLLVACQLDCIGDESSNNQPDVISWRHSVVMSNSANICQTFQPHESSPRNTKSSFEVILRSPQWKLFVWCGQICIFNYAKNYTALLALLHNLCSDYFQPHSLLSSGSRHRLSVGSGSGKSLKQSISSPAISDIIKRKVGWDTSGHGLWYYYVNVFPGPSEQPICW